MIVTLLWSMWSCRAIVDGLVVISHVGTEDAHTNQPQMSAAIFEIPISVLHI